MLGLDIVAENAFTKTSATQVMMRKESWLVYSLTLNCAWNTDVKSGCGGGGEQGLQTSIRASGIIDASTEAPPCISPPSTRVLSTRLVTQADTVEASLWQTQHSLQSSEWSGLCSLTSYC